MPGFEIFEQHAHIEHGPLIVRQLELVDYTKCDNAFAGPCRTKNSTVVLEYCAKFNRGEKTDSADGKLAYNSTKGIILPHFALQSS